MRKKKLDPKNIDTSVPTIQDTIRLLDALTHLKEWGYLKPWHDGTLTLSETFHKAIEEYIPQTNPENDLIDRKEDAASLLIINKHNINNPILYNPIMKLIILMLHGYTIVLSRHKTEHITE